MILAGFPKATSCSGFGSFKAHTLGLRSRSDPLCAVRHESQNIGTNTRFRWTIKPGNDLFIDWNRGWQRKI